MILRPDGTIRAATWSPREPTLEMWFGRNMVDYHRNERGTLLRLNDLVRVKEDGLFAQAGDIGTVHRIMEFDDGTAGAQVTLWRTGDKHVIGAQHLEKVDDTER
jgi:hypothetical protein